MRGEVKSTPQDSQSTHTGRGNSSKSVLDAEILKEYCAPATQPTGHLGYSVFFFFFLQDPSLYHGVWIPC